MSPKNVRPNRIEVFGNAFKKFSHPWACPQPDFDTYWHSLACPIMCPLHGLEFAESEGSSLPAGPVLHKAGYTAVQVSPPQEDITASATGNRQEPW